MPILGLLMDHETPATPHSDSTPMLSTDSHPESARIDHDGRLPVDRRSILGGGILFGLSALMAACNRGSQYVTNLPTPVWPDQQPSPVSGSSGPVCTKPTFVENTTPVQQLPGSLPSGVISRSRWAGNGPVMSRSNPMNGINRITVHHDAISAASGMSFDEAARRLESIRRGHVSGSHGWADIGYHFSIDPQGRVWECRPLNLQGAHVSDNNEHNIGVMLMGNFNQHGATNAQLAALDRFVSDQSRVFRVPISRVYTHRELRPTECPGDRLQRYMEGTRSFGGVMRKMAFA